MLTAAARVAELEGQLNAAADYTGVVTKRLIEADDRAAEAELRADEAESRLVDAERRADDAEDEAEREQSLRSMVENEAADELCLAEARLRTAEATERKLRHVLDWIGMLASREGLDIQAAVEGAIDGDITPGTTH